MFKQLFKRKSTVEKLFDKYEKLMKEAHVLSTQNRKASDEKYAQANAILQEIDKFKAQ